MAKTRVALNLAVCAFALTVFAQAEAVTSAPGAAAALSRSRLSDPNLVNSLKQPGQPESAFCEKCQAGESVGNSLLHNINYFLNIKKLELVPRTPNAAGDLLPVGMIDRGGKKPGLATAFLVTPCHILTNFHAAFGHLDAGKAGPDKFPPINFYYGQGKDRSFAGHVAVNRAVAWGNPTPKPGFSPGSRTDAEDWALLRLERCVGKEIGYLETLGVSTDRVPDATLNMIGLLRGADFQRGFYRDTNCRYGGGSYNDPKEPGTNMTHFCSGSHGSSGSPIYVLFHGHPVVIAMDASESSSELGEKDATSAGAYNGGVLLNGMYERMTSALNSTPEKDFILEQTGQAWRPQLLLEKWTAEGRQASR